MGIGWIGSACFEHDQRATYLKLPPRSRSALSSVQAIWPKDRNSSCLSIKPIEGWGRGPFDTPEGRRSRINGKTMDSVVCASPIRSDGDFDRRGSRKPIAQVLPSAVLLETQREIRAYHRCIYDRLLHMPVAALSSSGQAAKHG